MRRLGLLVLLAFVVLAFSLLFAGNARGGETVESVLARQPVFTEDRAELEAKAAQLRAIARAIEKASEARPGPVSKADWQALLLAVGFHESAWSLRIHRGECKRWECDRGRARGPWQLQRNDHTAPVWEQLHGIENVEAQALAASRMLTRGYWTCAKSGAHWLTGTLNGYAGARCTQQSGWQQRREQTWANARRRL